MGGDKPRSTRLSEMKTQQAAEHSSSLMQPVGDFIGSTAEAIEQRLKFHKANFEKGYQTSHNAGHNSLVATAAGVISFASGGAKLFVNEVKNEIDGFKAGFEQGEKREMQNKKHRFQGLDDI